MKYTKQSGMSGAWVDKMKLKNGMRAKIVSETTSQPSNFTNEDGTAKTQDVCKVRFEGLPDSYNVALNPATLNGLIDAFGEESKDWQGNYLTVEVEKTRVAGRAGYSLFLIPAGYEKRDDDNGYAVIARAGNVQDDIPIINDEEVEPTKIKEEDLPF